MSTADIEKLSEKVKKENVDGVIAGVHEFCIRKGIELCEQTGIESWCTLEQWDNCSNKKLFKEQCQSYGIDVAKTYKLNDDINYPVIVKPADSDGSRGFSICNNYEELEKGDKILMSANMLYWFPELKVGDSLKMVLNMGDDQVEKTFEIGAIGDYYESLGGSSFYLPQSVLEKMNPNNLNYTLEITVNDQKKNSAYQELQALADNSEYLVTGSYEEQLQKWEKNMRLMSVLCYAFLIILGGIGIMNLVNTMMNSIYTRRRELGMIQAIGMSEKQLIRMLQLEGIIYTLGTLAVSVGIGSLVGYGAFLYAKTRHMFQISEYHFPVVPAVLLICVVAFLQVLLTYGVSANFRKLSLIDRIRYAE